MIRGFLFDLDGTLVDTHRANFEAYKRALANFNVHITWEAFKPSIGQQAKVFLPRLAPNLSADHYDLIKSSKAAHYKELLHLTKANESLIEFMKAMADNYPIALVTTAQAENAASILKHHGLSDVFSVIVTAADVHNHKPHPDAYNEALRRLDLKPSEVITFEDSDTGIQAAKAAGIPVIVVKDFSI